MLSLTNACNLACRHCYRETAEAFADELSPVETVRVLREFADLAGSQARFGAVVFSGGEPLLARHLGLFARTALGLGLGVRINTNAILATPAVSRSLVAWGVRHAQVSLDGTTLAEHEAIRGPGTWELTRRGVRNLLTAGLEVAFKVTLMPGRNDADPVGFLRVAQDWGVETVSFARAVPLGAGSDLGQYDPAQWQRVLERLATGDGLRERSAGLAPWRRIKAEIRDATFDRAYLTGAPHRYAGEEGRIILAVDSDGTAYASRRMPFLLGNVRAQSIAELWAHPTLAAIRSGELTGKCRTCALRETCRGGSRAAAWSATGDPQAPDPACWVE
jgi:radical SAM protein with 4Fe4S-binding SPASM domain